MDRRPYRRTTFTSSDRERIGRDRWDVERDRDRRSPEGGLPPSSPLLDRLTALGRGRWIPISGNDSGRDG